VAVADHIRRQWPPPRSAFPLTGVGLALHRRLAGTKHDHFYALPLPHIAHSFSMSALETKASSPTSSPKKDDRVGVWQRHAGTAWTKAYPHVIRHVAGQGVPLRGVASRCGVTDEALQMAEHLVAGVLALHAVRVTHNDLHSHNLMIDDAGCTRLIDFDNACVEPAPKPTCRCKTDDRHRGMCGCVVSAEVPADARMYTAFMDSTLSVFVLRRWIYSPDQHVARDWQWLSEVLASTWPPAHLHSTETRRKHTKQEQRDEYWRNAVEMLRRADDQSALHAWFLIRTATRLR